VRGLGCVRRWWNCWRTPENRMWRRRCGRGRGCFWSRGLGS